MQEKENETSVGINILFGVYGLDEDNAKRLVRSLEEKGVNISRYGCKYRKLGIIEYLDKNQDTDVVIVSQCLESTSPYTKRDYQFLCDKYEKVRFIPLLMDDAKGGTFVRDLYHLGIFDGVFQSDADMDTLAKIISNRRSRKETKLYYDVNEDIEEMNSANISSCKAYIEVCSDDKELLEHVLHVLHMCTPSEFRNVLGVLSVERKEKIASFNNEELAPYFENVSVSGKETVRMKDSERKISVSKFTDKFTDGIRSTFKAGSIGGIARTVAEKIGAAVDAKIGKGKIEITEGKEENCQAEIEYLSNILNNELVGFAGISNKIGVTTQVIAVAFYLKNHGYRVAVFDVTGEKCTTFGALKAMENDAAILGEQELNYQGVTFYKVGKPEKINSYLSSFSEDTYNFILLDYGVINEEALSDIGRCGIRFVLGNASALECGAFLSFVKEHRTEADRYKYMVRGIPKKEWDKQDWLFEKIDNPVFIENCESPFEGIVSEGIQSVLEKYVNPGSAAPKRESGWQRKAENEKMEKIIVGTETIFVTSLRHGTGKTHFSVSLANYLAEQGNTVLVTEQQEMVNSLTKDSVEVYYDNVELNSLQNTRYLVLDYGNMTELSGYTLEEFERANRKVIMCWANDDFLGELAFFLQKLSTDTSNWYFVFNNVSPSRMKEVRRVMSAYNQCYLPVYDADSLPKDVKKILATVS